MLENKEFAAYSGGKAIDEGLRNYMLQIYNYMAGGLCATAAAAYLVANSSLLRLFVNESGYTGFGWLMLIAPLIMIFAFGWVLQNLSGLYRHEHCKSIFNYCRDFWRFELIRLYNQKGFERLG